MLLETVKSSLELHQLTADMVTLVKSCPQFKQHDKAIKALKWIHKYNEDKPKYAAKLSALRKDITDHCSQVVTRNKQH
jgi:uncharacterized protein (DUF608 family)